jgi:flagellin
MRAQNGAEQSRLHFALDTLAANQTNLESALSRIQDVDIAQTTSDLAKTRVLIDAGTAMSAQANSSQQSILKLLDSTRN